MNHSIIQYEYYLINREEQPEVYYTEKSIDNMPYGNFSDQYQFNIGKAANMWSKPYVHTSTESINPLGISVKGNKYDIHGITDDYDNSQKVETRITHSKYYDMYGYKDVNLCAAHTDVSPLDNGAYIKKIYQNNDIDEVLLRIYDNKIYQDRISTTTYENLRHFYGNIEILKYNDIKYERNNHGFVSNVIGAPFYKSYIHNDIDFNITMYTEYSVPMIYGLRGLYIAEKDHCFKICDEAEIDLKNNMVLMMIRNVYYMTTEEYLKSVNE